MKRQLSSLDLSYLVKEFEILKDSKINSIYNSEKKEFAFSFYKSNLGKILLKVIVGQYACIINEKESRGDVLGFGMFLRKHLEGLFLLDVVQLKPERILKFSFKNKDSKKYFYLEFIGKGNLILCDDKNVILNCLEHLEFKARTLKPKSNYEFPIMANDVFKMTKSQLGDLLKNSKKDSLVISLAVELGLGGIYAEEVCILSALDKQKSPKDLDEKEIKKINDTIKDIMNKSQEPRLVIKDKKVIDFSPFKLKFYDAFDEKITSTLSEAVNQFYLLFKETKETDFDKKMKSLQHIIEEQRLAIETLRNEESEFREKGELVYHKYSMIKEVLDELNKASKKYSWKEIKEKLKHHKMIKEINEKDRKVVVEI